MSDNPGHYTLSSAIALAHKGDLAKVRAEIEASTKDELMERYGITEFRPAAWERQYGVRFRRVCIACGEIKPGADMQVTTTGALAQRCKSCPPPPPPETRSRKQRHEDRLHDEYEPARAAAGRLLMLPLTRRATQDFHKRFARPE